MSVLTVPQAKDHLNLVVSTNDAEVQAFIDAAEAAIVKRCGPLVSTSVTERVWANCAALRLGTSPAISLTSVTPYGAAALTLGDLYLDKSSGIVTFNNGAPFYAQYYDVVYNAGRATMPADLLLAVKELLRHLWATQNGGPARPGSIPADSLPGSAYTFPIRVEQLIAPYVQMGV